jgi:hypothetical protein
MLLFSVIGLVLILTGACLCLFSGHIPVLRELTGAAPLETEPPTPAALVALAAADAQADAVASAAAVVSAEAGEPR